MNMSPVVYRDKCVGFIVRRRNEYEAFNIKEQSVGTFKTEADAVAALFKQGGASK